MKDRNNKIKKGNDKKTEMSDTETLLAEYNNQTMHSGKHSYSETIHNDDSSCCSLCDCCSDCLDTIGICMEC